MVTILDYDSLRSIFKHLDIYSLYSLVKVCSTWGKAAEDEINARGPMCLSIKKTDEEDSLEIVKSRLQDSLYVKPSFIIYSTSVGEENLFKNCYHYCNLPFYCYGVSLDNSDVLLKNNELKTMFFPITPNVNTNTLTFQYHPWGMIFCRELEFSFTGFLNTPHFERVFEHYFVKDTSINSCMILFCNRKSSSVAKDFLESLNNWLPNCKIPVWGGLVDAISICYYNRDVSICRGSTCISSIIISGTTLQAWNTAWDINSIQLIEKKLESLKETVQLKKHSIGFMFISLKRGNYWLSLEPFMFKHFFPNIRLMTLTGHRALGGVNFIETTRTKSIDGKLENIAETTVMILTYD